MTNMYLYFYLQINWFQNIQNLPLCPSIVSPIFVFQIPVFPSIDHGQNSINKRTNEFDFTTMILSGQLVFVCFLEEIEDTKKTFRN